MIRPRTSATVLCLVCAISWVSFGGRASGEEPAAGAPAAAAPGGKDGGAIDLSRFSTLDLSGGGAEEAAKPEEPRPVAGYDSKIGGFFLQSPDGKFLLKLNARIQARYTYFGKDPHQGDDGRDESYFELERARIGFSGHLFDPSLKYKIEFDGETDSSDKGSLTDAYVKYEPSERVGIGVGQFKPNFLREEYTSSAKFQRVERSLANEYFNIDRNIGVWTDGELTKMLYYNFALTNGIDTVNQQIFKTNGIQMDQPPAIVGKLDFTLAGDHKYSYEESDLKGLEKPLVVVGGSFVEETYNGTNEDTSFITTDGEVYSFGIDGVFKYRGFSLLGEYVGRWYDQKNDGSDSLYAHGFTIQGGAFVLRKPDIELTARFSAIYGNEGPKKGTGYEVGPGINWFISNNHNVKLQLDLAYIDIDSDLPSQTELLRKGPNQPFETTAAGFAAGDQGVLTRIQFQLTF